MSETKYTAYESDLEVRLPINQNGNALTVGCVLALLEEREAWRDLCKELYKHSNECMGMLGEAVPCLRAQQGGIPRRLVKRIEAYCENAYIQTPPLLRGECGQMLAEMHPEEAS